MKDEAFLKFLKENKVDYLKDKDELFFENNLVEIKNKIISGKTKQNIFSFKNLSLAFSSLILIALPLIMLLTGVFSVKPENPINKKPVAQSLNVSYDKAMYLSQKNFELVELARAGYSSAKIELYNSIYHDLKHNNSFDTGQDYSGYYNSEESVEINTNSKNETQLNKLAYAYTDLLINGGADS